jgi:hypothetical protein
MHLCKFFMKYVRAFLREISLKMLFQFVSVSPAAQILGSARSLFNFEFYFLQYCLHQEFFYLNRFLDEVFLLMFQPAAHSYRGKNI